MTVRELIEKLNEADPDSEIVVRVLCTDLGPCKVESARNFPWHNEFEIFVEE